MDIKKLSLLITVAILFLGASIWLGDYTANRAEKTKLKEELKKNETRIKELDKKLAGLAKQTKQIKTKSSPQSVTEKMIPAKLESAGFLNTIAFFAQKCKIIISSIKPNEITKTDNYLSQTYHINFCGNYPDILQFLNSINGLPRVMALDNVEIQRNGKSRLAEIELTIYGSEEDIAETSQFKLTGIVWDKKKPFAIIDNMYLGLGEKYLDKYDVKLITKETVLLNDTSNKCLILRIPE